MFPIGIGPNGETLTEQKLVSIIPVEPSLFGGKPIYFKINFRYARLKNIK